MCQQSPVVHLAQSFICFSMLPFFLRHKVFCFWFRLKMACVPLVLRWTRAALRIRIEKSAIETFHFFSLYERQLFLHTVRDRDESIFLFLPVFRILDRISRF